MLQPQARYEEKEVKCYANDEKRTKVKCMIKNKR